MKSGVECEMVHFLIFRPSPHRKRLTGRFWASNSISLPLAESKISKAENLDIST